MEGNQNLQLKIQEKELELVRARQEADFMQTAEGRQAELVRIEQAAKFALTPIGQEVKRFETLQRMGQMYANSTVVPTTYQNNIANCSIAMDMALRMGVNPLMVMQNLYLVHGMPSWSSKFLISTINTCGRFQPLRYECNNEKGDKYGYRCYTYTTDDKEKKERLEGPWITWAMVKAEGWDSKNGSKWKSMPEQMFRYRAAAFWQRLYAPEISMGFSTSEEMAEVQDVDFVEIPTDAAPTPKHDEEATPAPTQSLAERAAEAAMEQMQQTTQTETADECPVPEDDFEIEFDPETGEMIPS